MRDVHGRPFTESPGCDPYNSADRPAPVPASGRYQHLEVLSEDEIVTTIRARVGEMRLNKRNFRNA